MIPYIEQPVLELGPIKMYWFGAMVALGIVVGWNVAQRRALKLGLDMTVFSNALYWAFGLGFLFAHVLQVVWYRPGLILSDPLALLRIWESLSSFGGFVGILVGFLIYFNRNDAPFFRFGDTYAYGMTIGWAIARLGCTLANDHPGKPSNFFLAVDYPPGVYGGIARHNLGFYEAIITFGLFILLWYLAKKERREGFIMGILFISYSVIRFMLDFLRATDVMHADPRYVGLTPAQWASFLLLFFGIYCLYRSNKKNTPILKYVPQQELVTKRSRK